MKLKYLVLIALPLSSCHSFGPNAEELESQRIADNTKMGDSLAQVQAEQQRQADSFSSMKPELANNISLNTKTPADKKLVKTAGIKFQVGNVWNSTERIEDLTGKYEGYITYSYLQNRYENNSSINITRDSILTTCEVIVENEIRLRIPNIKLDSFIRELTPLVKFLDYRIIKMSDITFQYASIEKKGNRFKNYEKRQTSHIDTKDGKLKDVSSAEENMLERQIQADENEIKTRELEDQLKYCDITLEIYQKPIIIREVKADFNCIASSKPNFFVRLIDSIIQGYWILEELILFIFKALGVILLCIAAFFLIRYLTKLLKKK